MALASALRSIGELDRCRATLLEAIDLLPADAVARRVELTALCAAVEHWLGRHEEAHRRLDRAWEELPDRATPRRRRCRSSWRSTASTSWTSSRRSRWAARRSRPRAAWATAPCIAAAASALALGEAAAGEIAAAREHLAEALERVDRLSDAELAPRLEALYYLGWAENYLERYDDAVAHADRGIAIARAIGEGRLLVPLMLAQGLSVRDAGPPRRGDRGLRDGASRPRGCRATRTTSSGRCSSSAWRATTRATSTARSRRARRARGSAAGWRAGRCPPAGGGPGWALGVALFEPGEVERAPRR